MHDRCAININTLLCPSPVVKPLWGVFPLFLAWDGILLKTALRTQKASLYTNNAFIIKFMYSQECFLTATFTVMSLLYMPYEKSRACHCADNTQ